jgi:DNA modification methylase
MLKLNTIYNENNLKTLKKIPDNFLSGIITSPPYNIGKNPNHRKLNQVDYNLYLNNVDNLTEDEYLKERLEEFKQFDRTIKDDGVICYNLSYSKESPILPFKLILEIESKTNLCLSDIIYWKKFTSIPFQTSPNKLSRIVEPIYIIVHKEYLHTFKANKQVSSINKRTNQKFYKTYYNIFEAKNNNKFKTKLKAVFSTDMVSKLINIYFPKESIIYDPFMGIGTTAKSCIENNCSYIGSEIVKEFFEDSKIFIKK